MSILFGGETTFYLAEDTYTVYTLALNARDGTIKWHDKQAEQYTGWC